MTEHTHAVTLLRPEPKRPQVEQPRRLLEHRAWLVEAGLRARWGDRYATEHAMHLSLYGYDPVTLITAPGEPTFLLNLADDDVKAAHITADLMLQFAGEIAAQQLDLVANQFQNATPTPMARRDDMLTWLRRRAATVRHEAHRATPGR